MKLWIVKKLILLVKKKNEIIIIGYYCLLKCYSNILKKIMRNIIVFILIFISSAGLCKMHTYFII